MKKWLLGLFLILGLLQFVNAQSVHYQKAIGVKLLDGGGISYKQFVKGNNAFEGIAFFYQNGTRLTGLYEIHSPIADAPGLQWYYGPGAHVGIYDGNAGNGAYFGVDGVIGLDYKIQNAPINISLDWQPGFELAKGRGFYGGWGGLGIRITL